MNGPRAIVIGRWIAAGVIAGSGFFILARMFHGADSVPFAGRSLAGIVLLITGALFAAPELVRWAVSPMTHLLDSILLPSEEVHPPVDFRLARFYAQSLRYDEACDEYLHIIHYHPDNAEAFLEGIRVAALAGKEAVAAKLYHRAQRVMRSPDQRHLLEAVFAARHDLPNDASEAQLEDKIEPPPESDDSLPSPDNPSDSATK